MYRTLIYFGMATNTFFILASQLLWEKKNFVRVTGKKMKSISFFSRDTKAKEIKHVAI